MDASLWKWTEPGPEVPVLAAELGIPVPIACVLANRKITDAAAARRFLYGTLDDLHDPFLMAGMAKAVERVFAAIEAGEIIVVFGDYDADGILAMVMLRKALEKLGARVDHFIPERLRDGYGLKEGLIAVAEEKGARLVISVDCGIKADGFVRRARDLGIDVIVTDHHLPGPVRPEALAVLDPVLESSGYPDRRLAGVGVAYKLIQALFKRRGLEGDLPPYLKLVAIGTISDVAALRGENRIMVSRGLKELGGRHRPGLQSLIDVCRLTGKRITEGDVGFRIGPRINAAGRMGNTQLAVELFFTEEKLRAAEIAGRLDQLNAKRQRAEDKIFAQAVEMIRSEDMERERILILGHESWNRGIVGIVASRLKEAYTRPAIVFGYEDGKAYGSGRSIPEFSLIDCLEECRDYFLSYGGHKYAVGCTIDLERLPDFRAEAARIASSRITDEDLRRKVRIDAGIGFSDITPSFLETLALLGPFGVENPRPVFLAEGAEIIGRPRKLKDSHVKFTVRHQGLLHQAIGWEKGEWFPKIEKIGPGDRVDIVFALQASTYLGKEELYLSLEAMRRSA